MGKDNPKEQPTKPLSAWERRKLYSKKLTVRIQPDKQVAATNASRRNEGDDKENSTSKKRKFTTAFSRDANAEGNVGERDPKKSKYNAVASTALTTKQSRKSLSLPVRKLKANEKGRTLSSAKQAAPLARPMPTKAGSRTSTVTFSATDKPDRDRTKRPAQPSLTAGPGGTPQGMSDCSHPTQKNPQMQQPKGGNPKVAAKRPVTHASGFKTAKNLRRRSISKGQGVSEGSAAVTVPGVPSSKSMKTKVHQPRKSNPLLKTEKAVEGCLKNGDTEGRERAKGGCVSLPTKRKVNGRSPRSVLAGSCVGRQIQDTRPRRPACLASNGKSIMKKVNGSTPATGQSTAGKLKSRVSFKYMTKLTVAASLGFSPDSLEGTPQQKTSSPSSLVTATPYRSAEEAFPSSSESSTEDEYRTPFVQRYMLRKSAGGTPYRLPSAETEIDNALKKSAGSTPYRQASSKAEREHSGEEDDLNATFTKEDEGIDAEEVQQPSEPAKQDEKARESARCPLSCLKGNGSARQSRKSVSFVTTRKQQTPKPIPKTLQNGSAARADLESWLQNRGHSISAYRHLHCLGIDDTSLQRSSTKKVRKQTPYVVRGSAKMPPLDASLGASPPLPTKPPGQDKDAASVDIASTLKELYSLLKDGYPPTKVNAWMDALEQKVPDVRSSAVYWMCRSLSSEKAEDFAAAADWLVNGLDHMQAANEELLDNLHRLVNAVPAKENIVPGTEEHDRRRSRRQKALEVSPGNAFESTRLDYAVLEKGVIDRISMTATGRKSAPHAVLTPVRRSTRLCGNGTKAPNPSPAALLFRKNPALPSM